MRLDSFTALALLFATRRSSLRCQHRQHAYMHPPAYGNPEGAKQTTVNE